MSARWRHLVDDVGNLHLPVVLVVAHPDDETVGAGGTLPHLENAHVLVVTDGAPRNLHDAHAAGCSTRSEYARLRRRELDAAMQVAGLGEDRIHFLGFVDQEASLHLADAARGIADCLRRLRPAFVLTHPYEGGHPDHDATSFSVHAAQHLLHGDQAWEAVEMTSYFHGEEGMVTVRFLDGSRDDVLTVELKDGQRARKRAMLDCYASQQRTLAPFGVEREKFRAAPEYNFREPPHEGQLWYEHFDWGMDGVTWRRLAGEALAELELAR